MDHETNNDSASGESFSLQRHPTCNHDDALRLSHNNENGSTVVPPVSPKTSHDFLQTFAGVVGNVLEWYDFAVFGFFSDTIGQVFFPPQAGHSQTVESFAVFGLAFLMRPVGGVLMGYIGDVYGRKKALIISIFMMAFPTFLMGCLPSYEQVGPVAIVLLILTRMLQGMSVGGQLVSSLVYTLESHDPSVWGLYGSFVLAAANFGTLLGNLAAFVLQNSLSEEQLLSYGWRLPFLSGIIVSFSGFYLRRSGGEDHAGRGHVDSPTLEQGVSTYELADDELEEEAERQDTNNSSYRNNNTTESFNEEEGETQASFDETTITSTPINPLRQAFSKGNLRALAAATMVPMLWSAGFYLSFVWMATYMDELAETTIQNSFGVNAFSLLLSVCFFFPVAGSISDRFGRVRTMTFGGISMGLLSPLLVWIIGQGHVFGAFIAQMVLGISLSFWGAPMCAWLVESFDPAARLTSVAIGYNVAQATAGGMSPAIATLLADNVSPNTPGWILTVLALIALTGLRCVAPPRNTNMSVRQFAPVANNQRDAQKKEIELTKADHELL